jgi:hypothetical protein
MPATTIRKTVGRGTIWTTPQKTSESIHRFLRLTAQKKKLETALAELKEELGNYAEGRLTTDILKTGVLPASPIKLTTPSAKSVSFILQDGTEGMEIVAADEERLVDGGFDLSDSVEERECFAFDPNVLRENGPNGEPIIGSVVEGLKLFADDLAVGHQITKDQAKRLIVFRTRRTLKDKLLPRLAALSKGNLSRFKAGFTALGSAITRYVKA